ncbi:hypothetical protein ANN_02115 [Periplaneta americana]|uniref:Reverse transcriptase n=1 Tax=Periplaneta americana TaxID=6978 RepID=A0ABQ8TVD2_PERAM|nr:hypothetical protein ANN_02115 [Periplaneta americana]
MGESRNAYRVLDGRPQGKRPLGRSRRRWEDNIKMDLREVGHDDRDWINLAQDRDQWRAYVRAAMAISCKQTTTTVDATIQVQWPPRSPDLSPLYFFMWGTVKDSVYQNILTTPDDMQQRIRQACVSIQPATRRAVIQSFENAFECVLM